MSLTEGLFLASYNVFIALIFLIVPLLYPAGLPPFLPQALAEVRPAFVLLDMISLSNSASDANMLNGNRPVAVLVSIPSCRLEKLTSRCCIFFNQVDQVL